MWNKFVVPAVCAAAFAAMPATAATTVQVNTTSNIGWAVITPGGTTVPANSVVPNSAWANVPWISAGTSGRQNIAAGSYQYVFTLGQPGLFGLLSGLVYTDNRLNRIFVNGDTTKGIALADLGGNQFGPGKGRAIAFDLSSFGVISSITFATNNDTNSPTPAGFSSNMSAPAIPEPGTWMLMILGLGAVGFAMRRRQNATVRLQFA